MFADKSRELFDVNAGVFLTFLTAAVFGRCLLLSVIHNHTTTVRVEYDRLRCDTRPHVYVRSKADGRVSFHSLIHIRLIKSMTCRNKQ